MQHPTDPFLLSWTSPTLVEDRSAFSYDANFLDRDISALKFPSRPSGLGAAGQELPATSRSLNSKSLGFALLKCGIGWDSSGLELCWGQDICGLHWLRNLSWFAATENLCVYIQTLTSGWVLYKYKLTKVHDLRKDYYTHTAMGAIVIRRSSSLYRFFQNNLILKS